jgi:hypothetical protein
MKNQIFNEFFQNIDFSICFSPEHVRVI